MNKLSLSLLVLCTLLTISMTSASNEYSISEVSSGIYYHQGVHEEPSEVNIGAIANVGFIIGDRCVAVIDTGGSYLEGTLLKQAIRTKTDLPICYVINTHVHPDHIFGNAAFKEDKPIFVGHEKLPAAIAAREGFFAKTFKVTLGKAYAGTEFISPTKTASLGEPITLDLGNRKLTLTAYSTSHTDHDLTVFDNKTKTLWTGDLLFMGRIPVMDGSINGWIKTMIEMQKLELNFLVPGHGEASSDKWQQGLAKQLHYFTLLRDEIRIIIEDLGTIDQASKQVGILEQNSWELFEHYHRRNVTASFVQLEWE
ncbi:MAG: quinoprotein relay system zinc metallohydrolase 2 [Gammaproteobacteria bacterium]|nr:quinoprotein relay system zinc metallohydrolase 2 [Gammaproteobacteria bacterium]